MLTECTSSTFSEAHSKDWLVPGYELVEVIGEGGFSLVYRAQQHSTGQDVAIKILQLSKAHNHLHHERSIERFEREIRLCAGLQHPNIVKLLDKGETTDKRLFAVFEYVPGQTLREYIKNTGAMTAPEAGHVMAQVLDALICAHKQGIVHRDLKPQNIMLTTSGVNAQVKILDFGIGTIVPQFRPADFLTLTQSQESCGTPSYSAPEQLRGEPATVQTDLYAWGLVYLECLIAVPVMQGVSAAEIYHRQLSAQEVPIPAAIINHPLASILRRVLKKKPDERCSDAQSLWRALRGINLADIVGAVHSSCEQYPSGNEATLMNNGAFKEKRQITVLCVSVSVVPDFNDAMVKSSDIEVLEILQQDQLNQCRDIASRFGGKIAGCLADRMLVYF
ncbi:Adenylate cyclase / Guanylate cyclase, partial [hydrothermal vent metagenome]